MNTNLEPVPSAHYLSLYMCTSEVHTRHIHTHTQALVTGNDHRKLRQRDFENKPIRHQEK